MYFLSSLYTHFGCETYLKLNKQINKINVHSHNKDRDQWLTTVGFYTLYFRFGEFSTDEKKDWKARMILN